MLSKKSLLFRKKISLKFVEFMNQQNIDYLFLGHISNFPTKWLHFRGRLYEAWIALSTINSYPVDKF